MIGGIMFIVAVALVVLIWWGSKAVFDGAVTTGQLAQFMIYALMATNALTSISEVLGSLQTVAGATERLIEILDTQASHRLAGPARRCCPSRRSAPSPSRTSTSPMRRATTSRSSPS